MHDSPTPPSDARQPPGVARRVHWACYGLLTLLLAYVLVVRHARPLLLNEPITVEPLLVQQVEQRIDPNTASWSELASLPDIGESLAKRIVDYRQSRRSAARADANTPVFLSPTDLEAVSGIGPKTVARIAPYLKLPPTAPTAQRGSGDPMGQR